jgi:hypothetical protein
MATIDLGKIKLVNRGAYNNSTAYTVDDLVQSGGTTYICIQNSTGNAVTNSSYWNVLAQGGTDIGTTLTTQGDILYRDGSGLQRLAAGTSGQVLQTGGSGANPSWTAVASDCVKLASVNNDNVNASYYDFQSAFNESTYQNYKFIWTMTASTSIDPGITYLDSSNGELTGSQDYARAGHQAYRKYSDNSGNSEEAWNDAVGTNRIQVSGWNQNSDANQVQSGIVEFNLPKPSVAALHQAAKTYAWGYSTSSWMFVSHSGTLYTGSNAITGFRFKVGSGNITKFYATLYGFKK